MSSTRSARATSVMAVVGLGLVVAPAAHANGGPIVGFVAGAVLLVFVVAWLVGLVISLIRRPKRPADTLTCPKCRDTVSKRADSCPNCGLSFKGISIFFANSDKHPGSPWQNFKESSHACSNILVLIEVVGLLGVLLWAILTSRCTP